MYGRNPFFPNLKLLENLDNSNQTSFPFVSQTLHFYPRFLRFLDFSAFYCSSVAKDVISPLNHSRPVVKDCEAHIYIKQGRHPVLDSLLLENEQFVPNDTHMNVSELS